MINFNFPFIMHSFLANTEANNQKEVNTAIVIPFTNNNGQIFLNSDTPKELIPLIEKDNISFIHNNTYFSFVDMSKNKTFEKSLGIEISKINKKFNNIKLWVEGFDYNAIGLVSEIALQNKTEWNMKSKNDKTPTELPRSIFIIDKTGKIDSMAVKHGLAQAQAQAFVQYLIKLPSNMLTPTHFYKEIENYLKEHKLQNIKMNTKNGDTIKQMGMGAFYAVSKGSTETAQLITMMYDGNPHPDKPVVFVGKGITFDSGGISLKPSKGMQNMKGDMAGAATAAGIMIYAALMELPINLVSILACCENMPDGNSLKPGDIITAMNGKTIEVVDTDAEGRLVLADALVYAQKYDGKYTIDMATLTGACITALGSVHTGLFSNDLDLVFQLSEAGSNIKDTVWHMPMEGYEFLIKSDIADLCNLKTDSGAGAQNGAVFLAEFAPKNNWAHMDIAGTSQISTANNPTGRPLPLLAEFLRNLTVR